MADNHTQGKVELVETVNILDCNGKCGSTPSLKDCPNKCKQTFMGSKSKVVYKLPDTIPTEQAVKYIEHGAEMAGIISMAKDVIPQCQLKNEMIKLIEKIRN